MFHGIKNKLNIGNVFPAKLFFSGDIEIDIKFVVGETTSLDEAEQLMDHNHH
jgi:copper(I)-binding protein